MSRPDRSNDWEPLRELTRDIGRPFENVGALQALRAVRQFPAFNLYDARDHFILITELPGLSSSDFELSMTGDAVTLRGERVRDNLVRDDAYRRQERPFGSWSRTISLPGKIDPDQVTASLAHGVLTIVIPKAEEHRIRPIAVTTLGN
jgi:HSP20 family protein